MIAFRIDEIVPCLKHNATGNYVETEAAKVERKSYLSNFNRHTGWYVDWSQFLKDCEVYALLIKGTTDVQGLIAVQYDDSAKAVYIRWGCTSPQNNIWQYGTQEYSGVGGHLIAMAAELSEKHGYEGFVYGEAMDEELYEHYCTRYHALPLPRLGKNTPRFMISGDVTKALREEYDYEWTTAIL